MNTQILFQSHQFNSVGNAVRLPGADSIVAGLALILSMLVMTTLATPAEAGLNLMHFAKGGQGTVLFED